jgi:hypothetical protein
MARHEGNTRGNGRSNAVWGSGKIAAVAAALVAAIALVAPGTAGATTGSGLKAYSASGSAPVTVSFNSSMIVDLSGSAGTSGETVSWSDVSWSDSL